MTDHDWVVTTAVVGGLAVVGTVVIISQTARNRRKDKHAQAVLDISKVAICVERVLEEARVTQQNEQPYHTVTALQYELRDALRPFEFRLPECQALAHTEKAEFILKRADAVEEEIAAEYQRLKQPRMRFASF
jgi:hypothetical protein